MSCLTIIMLAQLFLYILIYINFSHYLSHFKKYHDDAVTWLFFFFSSSSLSSLFERCWNKVTVNPVLYLFQLLCACVCLRTTLIHNNVYYLFISEILTLHLVFYFISCFASSIYDYFTLFLYSLLEIVSFQYLL